MPKPKRLSRRQFMMSASALAGSLVALPASATSFNNPSYSEVESSIWYLAEVDSVDPIAVLQALVRYATLAPSSHNTQCWQFTIETASTSQENHIITIMPDLARRCPAVDPDDHHLFVSLGCALENLCQAAAAHGLLAEYVFDESDGNRIRVMLQAMPELRSALFYAIPKRQCTRSEYDGLAIAHEDLLLLTQAATTSGVRLMLLTDAPSKEKVLDFVVQANTVQMNTPSFVDELKTWIRFSDQEAIEKRDGLSTKASGNPSVPRWLASLLFSQFYTPEAENEKYAKHIRSSSGIAIFSAEIADKKHWIEVGRCYQRFALQATTLNIRNAFINQPIEVATFRLPFAQAFGLNSQGVDLIVRFGRGSTMPHSLRRPVAAVLV